MARDTRIGLIGYGTTHWAIVESRDQLVAEYGIDTSYLRLRAYPFTPEVGQFIDRCDRVYVVEQNRDAQMLSLLKMECTPEQFAKLRSVLHYVGLPIDGRSVTTELVKQEQVATT
jgi:2-oxoglutarate ferredoxin oxidoreductase subunit alpha